MPSSSVENLSRDQLFARTPVPVPSVLSMGKPLSLEERDLARRLVGEHKSFMEIWTAVRGREIAAPRQE